MCKFASFNNRANAEALQDARAAGSAWNVLHQAKQPERNKRQRETTSAFDFAFDLGASSYAASAAASSFPGSARSSANHQQQVASSPGSAGASLATGAVCAPSVDKWRSQLDAGLAEVSKLPGSRACFLLHTNFWGHVPFGSDKHLPP
jgi:hypothetical protein